MAWLEPKIDWAPEDGVRDEDFNRIEQNIKHLHDSAADLTSNILTEDLTVYISPSGNDDTGDGTSGKPFKTFAKALSVLPRNLSGREAAINVAAGTYNEAVTISGFDSTVILTGFIGAAVTVNSLRVTGCICELSNIDLTANGAVFITNGAKLISDSVVTAKGSPITVNYGAVAHIGTANVTGVSGYAIEVNRGGRFYASAITGSGNTNSIRCQSGGEASFGSNTMSVSGTLYMTANGGRIYSGSQQSIPIY